MSMWRYDFVIYGFDLSDIKNSLNEWFHNTPEGEACYDQLLSEEVGKWSLFDDPADGNHFYLGYVLGKCIEYDGFTSPIIFDPYDLVHSVPNYHGIPVELREMLVRKHNYNINSDDGRIIAFTEWR